jgi:hypothetical protein
MWNVRAWPCFGRFLFAWKAAFKAAFGAPRKTRSRTGRNAFCKMGRGHRRPEREKAGRPSVHTGRCKLAVVGLREGPGLAGSKFKPPRLPPEAFAPWSRQATPPPVARQAHCLLPQLSKSCTQQSPMARSAFLPKNASWNPHTRFAFLLSKPSRVIERSLGQSVTAQVRSVHVPMPHRQNPGRAARDWVSRGGRRGLAKPRRRAPRRPVADSPIPADAAPGPPRCADPRRASPATGTELARFSVKTFLLTRDQS